MNHTLIRFCAALLLLAFGLFWHKPAQAAFSCSVVAPTPINFTVNALSTQTDVSGNLTVTCTNPGNTAASAMICFTMSDAVSYMKNGSQELAYELFQDPAYTIPWGSTFNDNRQIPITLLGSASGDGSRQILVPFNARVLGGQNPVPGTAYTDQYPPGQTQMTVNILAGTTPPSSCSTTNPQQFGFKANANIINQCIVTAPTLDFGTQGPLTAAVSTQTDVTVQCPVGTAYSVGLDGGQNSGNNINARRMVLGANSVAYQLYTDSGHTQVWGNTKDVDTVAGTGTGNPINYTVYGNVPAQTTPPAGTYQDVIVVSVTY